MSIARCRGARGLVSRLQEGFTSDSFFCRTLEKIQFLYYVYRAYKGVSRIPGPLPSGVEMVSTVDFGGVRV